MANLYQLLDVHNVKISAIGHLNDELESPDLLSKIDACDLVLINGEGTIHHGKPYAETLLRVVAQSNAKTKVLLNSTYQDNPIHFRDYLAKLDRIYVRDDKSRMELSDIGIASQVVPDLTFLSKSDPETLPDGKTLLGCSVDREVMVHLHKLGKRLGKQAQPLSIFQRNTNTARRLLEIRRSLAVSDLRSPVTMYRIAAARHWFSRNALDTDREFSSQVAKSAFLISGRYHAICMAIKNKTPFLAIESNTFKIQALLSDIGLENRCITKSDFLAGMDLKFKQFNSDELELIEAFEKRANNAITNMFAQIIEHE